MTQQTLVPADLPQPGEIVAGISPAPSEPTVVRCDPAAPKQILESAHWFLGELTRDLEAASRATTSAADSVAAVKKLKKRCAKKAQTLPCYKSDLEEAGRRLLRAEQALAVAQNQEKNAKRRVERQKQGIAELLKHASKEALSSL
jgi:chromosome segregation ATPase